MEYIKKSIYSLPEIRRGLKPLWSVWALVAAGAVCGALYWFLPGLSQGLASMLGAMAVLGVMTLVLLLGFYLFGDSRFPYHRGRHSLLEPTVAYYAAAAQGQLVSALQAGDEQALEAVKRQPRPDLVLVRYSDDEDSLFYSQLLRVEGSRWEPITDIFINDLKQK
ncbi:MAG: hypothetical protein J6I49_09205 [Bacteroidales bacterium]|nr:hypothetical protein [Bacteroidales bacterium]